MSRFPTVPRPATPQERAQEVPVAPLLPAAKAKRLRLSEAHDALSLECQIRAADEVLRNALRLAAELPKSHRTRIFRLIATARNALLCTEVEMGDVIAEASQVVAPADGTVPF